MATLSEAHRRYIQGETITSMVINTFISIAFAVGVSRGAAVPVKTMAIDFAPQVFMVTFATTLATTLIARKRIAAGRVAPLPKAQGGPLAFAPTNLLARAVLFGLIIGIVVAPISAGLLIATGAQAWPAPPFVLFKAVYGAVLSAVVAPFIARAALIVEAPQPA